MLAQVLTKNSTPSGSFTLQEIAKPVPGSGQVCIRVTAYGLNFADIMARQGLYRECPPLPCVIGYDVEGVIDSVGPDVQGFQPGDKVFALTRFGAYAEYAVTQAAAVSLMPEGMPIGTGCALATQCVTAYYAAIHTQTLSPGEKVLVHAAAGGLGTALIQIALWKGCTVIGIAGGQHKSDHLRQLGVQHVIDHHTTSYESYIQQQLKGRVDVIFDNVGGTSVRKGKALLAPGGRIVTLGGAALSGKKGYLQLIRFALGFGFFSPISFLGKSQSLIGVNMLRIADYRPDLIEASFKGVVKLYLEGILRPHVDRVFQYDQLDQAHTYVENRKSMGKVVVSWQTN